MFGDLVRKTKRMVGIDTEDYKSKFFYSEKRVQELENKMFVVQEHLDSIIKLINHKGNY